MTIFVFSLFLAAVPVIGAIVVGVNAYRSSGDNAPGYLAMFILVSLGVCVAMVGLAISDDVASIQKSDEIIAQWEEDLGDRIEAPSYDEWTAPAVWTFNREERTCFVDGPTVRETILDLDDELTLLCRDGAGSFVPTARSTS